MQANELIITAFAGKVFAIDRATGAQKWRVEFSEWSGGAVELVVTEQRVIAVTGGWLGIIERTTGKVLKKVERKEKGAQGRPVLLVDGDRLIIGGAGAVACWTLDGDFLWDQYFAGEGTGAVALGVPGNVRQADDAGRR
ncbi:MAG: PQQ-binding-like beta-propeller repeat protein [Archangium sp.]|nr:PQQ-binding-like beta-propeller repeat protein [Archangium sp.]